MSAGVTMGMVDAIIAQLKVKLPNLAVEYFPERPDDYRLNHPKGALLVHYPGANFTPPSDTGFVVQEREMVFTITVIMRQLNGRDGAVNVLDELKLALIGFKPPNCRRKCWARHEKFLGQVSGLWQYALDIATTGVAVEDVQVATGVPVQSVGAVEDFEENE